MKKKMCTKHYCNLRRQDYIKIQQLKSSWGNSAPLVKETQECLSTFLQAMTTGYALLSPSMPWNWEFPWAGWERAPSVGLCPWLPIIALTGTKSTISRTSLLSYTMKATNQVISTSIQVFLPSNLIHNFVHILLCFWETISTIYRNLKRLMSHSCCCC